VEAGIGVNDLLKFAIDGHGCAWHWGAVLPVRGAWVSGAIWALQGKPGLLESMVLAGETRDRRLTIIPLPWPGRRTTWESYRQTIQTTDGVLAAGRDPVLPPGGPGLAAS
jgi:hypothetical protein